MEMNDEKRIRKVERIAHALGPCLHQLFRQDLSGAGIKLNVQEKSRSKYEDGKGIVSVFLFTSSDGVAPVEVLAHVDGGQGNVYDFWVTADGGAQRYTVSVPDPILEADDFSPASVQAFMEDLCRDLLPQIERATGRKKLRNATGESAD